MKITKQELRRIIKEELSHETSMKDVIDVMTDFEKIGLDYGKTSKAIDQKLYDLGFVAGKINFGLMNLIKIVSTKCARLGFDLSDTFNRRLKFGYRDGLDVFKEKSNNTSVKEAVSFSNVSKEDEMDLDKHSRENTIIAPSNFSLIDSDFYEWKYRNIQKGDALIVLRELEMTSNVVDDAQDAALDSTRLVRSDELLKFHRLAEVEFKNTGKIKGYEILNLETKKKLWISHYDMEILEKSNTSKVEESNAMGSGAVVGYTAPIGFKPPTKTKK